MSTNLHASYYIGIDVGTGSARASLVSSTGETIASSTRETRTWRDTSDHRIFEQSTDDIWNAIRGCIHDCLDRSEGKVTKEQVKGLGFDATCSLAVTRLPSHGGEPVSITRGPQLGEIGERNIILWADHRAEKEAEVINGTGSVVLDYVGGTMSVSLSRPIAMKGLINDIARDGDTQDSMAEEQYGTISFRPVPVFRSTRLSHISCNWIWHSLVLFIGL